MWDTTWEEVFSNQSWGKYPAEDLIRFIALNFYDNPNRNQLRILEIGCGPGANICYLAREGFGFIGIDGSPTALRQTADRLDDECPDWHNYGELHQGDIGKIPFPDNSIDVVIDNEAVYCNDWENSISIYTEARRVLRSGGKIFVRTFASGSWGDKTGEAVGRNAYFCSEGPLSGKGFTRFTEYSEIPDLLVKFKNLSIELVTRTMKEQQHTVKEWIITAEK